MKEFIGAAAILIAFGFTSIEVQHRAYRVKEKQNLSIEKNISSMNSFISLFEIPATDISRAVHFYEGILDIDIEIMEMQGMEMGIFPYVDQVVPGVIMKEEGNRPSADGPTIYLNGGDNLQIILEKVEQNGGKIIVPKTALADESGFFALFLDSEGNKLGLHSPH